MDNLLLNPSELHVVSFGKSTPFQAQNNVKVSQFAVKPSVTKSAQKIEKNVEKA